MKRAVPPAKSALLARVTFMSAVAACTLVFGPLSSVTSTSTLWHIVPGRDLTDPPQDTLLFGVSCPVPNSCVAVGYDGNSSLQGTLVYTLSGGTWRVTPSPVTPAPYVLDALNDVSCSSPGSCTAVGWATNEAGDTERALVETLRNGTWRVTPSPGTTAEFADLSGVSCPSPGSCVAVGEAGTPNSQRTLLETLRRGTWRVMPGPVANPPNVVNFLNAVSCTSPAHCVAAGFSATSDGMDSRTLVMTLDGGKWTITSSPDTASPINDLFGVWCSNASSCIAVGDHGNTASQETLIETLSGSKWRITPSPNTALGLNNLYGAWCRSPGSCAAAGYAMNSEGSEAKTLIEDLRSGTWTMTPTSNTTSRLNELYGYSCSSSTSCYVVGIRGDDHVQKALVEAS